MSSPTPSSASPPQFRGFEYPDANYIYCPNQFFDVCLSAASRPVVRLVAYILRQTLGWLDKNGEPVEQNISVSYRDLINGAGISRGSIRPALDDAVSGGFISCIEPGRANSSGNAAQTARYVLRWDAGNQYVKAPDDFSGFFTGEGHRTPIPNSFFDVLVPRETLAVVKVVGTVLRHTVGYENQIGGRRNSAPLSYTAIQNYANLKDRTTLSTALQRALSSGYICRESDGCFHPDANTQCSATYAVHWLSEVTIERDSSKNLPAKPKRFKIPTSNGSKSPPVEQFKNPTSRKTKQKDILKQQQVAAADLNSVALLIDAGFEEAVATNLAAIRSPEEISNQIRWIEKRSSSVNRLGLLRKAIEENWPKPTAFHDVNRSKRQRDGEQQVAEAACETEKQRTRVSKNTAKRERWSRMTDDARQQIRAIAIQNVTSDSERRTLSTITDLANLSSGAFVIICRFLDSPAGESSL